VGWGSGGGREAVVLDGDVEDDVGDEVGWAAEDDGSWLVLPGKAEVGWIVLDKLLVGIGLWVMTVVWLIDSEQVVVAFPDR
jgi:hypothetical protein